MQPLSDVEAREGSVPSSSPPASSPSHQQGFELVRKFQGAFDAMVAALTKYDEERARDRRATDEAIEEKESKPDLKPAQAEAGPENSVSKDEVIQKNGDPKPDSSMVPKESDTSQPPVSPAKDGGTADSTKASAQPVEEKRTLNSLFGAITSQPPSSSSASPAPVASPHLSYTAVASKAIVKALKELLEGCGSAKEAAKCGPYAPWVATLLMQYPSLLEDHNVALFAICFCNSACTYASQLDTVIDGDVIYEFIMAVLKIHRRQKKITHVCFSGLVNVCHAPKLSATTIVPLQLTEYLAPLHAESPVVEAWCMATTNICLRFPILIKTFCDIGAVSMLERLLLLFGDDPRILSRGLTLLAIFTQQTVMAEGSAPQ